MWTITTFLPHTTCHMSKYGQNCVHLHNSSIALKVKLKKKKKKKRKKKRKTDNTIPFINCPHNTLHIRRNHLPLSFSFKQSPFLPKKKLQTIADSLFKSIFLSILYNIQNSIYSYNFNIHLINIH